MTCGFSINSCLLPFSSSASIYSRRFIHSKTLATFFSRILVLLIDYVILLTGFVVNSNHVESKTSLKGLKDEVLSVLSQDVGKVGVETDGHSQSAVSITVVGASGDLAKKKIFPALFALFYGGCLPEHFTIYAYSTSKMTDVERRDMISKTLICRIDKRAKCAEKMEEILKKCFYHCGKYDSEEHFTALDKKLKEHEAGRISNRLFYLSIPPNIFVDVVKCASTTSSSVKGWTRVIVEKHFARDSETSTALTKSLK